MENPFKQSDYRRPTDTAGLVKLSTVFGVRYSAPHEFARASDTVACAEGRNMSRCVARCYVVGVWPQSSAKIAKQRKLILDGLKSVRA